MKKIILFFVFSFCINTMFPQESSTPLPFATTGDNLGVWNGSYYTPLFIKGINLGAAIPGTQPGQLAITRDQYQRWFKRMGEVGFNSIRIYTLHFPRFYEELARYNREHPNKPLYVFQGIWLDEIYEGNDLFSTSEKFDADIEEVVDCVHGNRQIEQRPGRAYGVYDTDISEWVIAYIIGREIHPGEVLTTNELHQEINQYNGTAVSLPEGTPTDVWAAQRVDKVICWERENYQTERPISVSSWPTLDPLDHPTEMAYGQYEDTASVDLANLDISNALAGYFASFHAYPYYPDFMSEDPGYQQYSDDYGPNSYLGYLHDLREHYSRFPLIIGEYGVPSSWGNAHFAHSGMHHGGENETEQGEFNIRILENIRESGCGGGLQFAWMDEWFKRTWIADPFDYLNDRRHLWHNITSPEQNFGLIDFESIPPSYSTWQTYDNECKVNKIKVSADNDFFQLRLFLDAPLQPNDTVWLAIDSYDSELGESILPNGKTVENRAEFLLQITPYDSATLFVTQAYDLFGIWHHVSPPEQLYHSIPTDGAPWNLVRWKNNRYEDAIQDIGKLHWRRRSEEPSVHDAVVLGNDSVDIHLPWSLLNVVDPSSHTIMHDNRDTEETEDTITDGFTVTMFIGDCKYETPNRYLWDGWNVPPETVEREKKSMQIVTDGLRQFNNEPLVKSNHYTVKENQSLIVNAPEGILANDIEFDGDTLEAMLIQSGFPKHGELQLQKDGSFVFIPAAGFSGSDLFFYQASDGIANSNISYAEIEVKPVNEPPIAADDMFQTVEDLPLSIDKENGLLANDTDADNDNLTVEILKTTNYGELVWQNDGSFTYKPNTNFYGQDGFSYIVSDGEFSDTASVTLTIHAVNDAPVANDLYFSMIDEMSIQITNSDHNLFIDVDSDNLTAEILSYPENGSLTTDENGTFIYSINSFFCSLEQFTFSVTDGEYASTGTIFIDVGCKTSSMNIEKEAAEIAVYPNPVDDMLFITTKNNINSQTSVSLYTTSGKKIYSADYYEARIVMNIRRYPAGLYILEVINGKTKTRKKIVIR